MFAIVEVGARCNVHITKSIKKFSGIFTVPGP
jgi:hypothetical protein